MVTVLSLWVTHAHFALSQKAQSRRLVQESRLPLLLVTMARISAVIVSLWDMLSLSQKAQRQRPAQSRKPVHKSALLLVTMARIWTVMVTVLSLWVTHAHFALSQKAQSRRLVQESRLPLLLVTMARIWTVMVTVLSLWDTQAHFALSQKAQNRRLVQESRLPLLVTMARIWTVWDGDILRRPEVCVMSALILAISGNGPDPSFPLD